MEREITITDNFMFATVMKGESINVIRTRNGASCWNIFLELRPMTNSPGIFANGGKST
nr:hypothetical protein [uncultured Treponema sp.]